MSELCVMGIEGDVKTIWDASNEAEVAAAEATFNQMREKGYFAYKVNKDGKKGEIIREFEPDAEKIILAPPMQGG